MRVFVTGATGFVGSAVVKELLNAGHQVLGLARSEASAQSLRAIGADVQYGDIEDLESLRSGASMADGIIHTAFNHDFSKFKDNCEADRHVIEAMGDVLAGSDRPFIITSAIGLLASADLATEDQAVNASSSVIPRVATEEAAAAVAAKGVHVSLVRLPPSVHGDGDHGFIPILINLAREKGIAAFVGEGRNRWAAVHRLDAANLYRLALEKGAAGARYHAVADQGIPMRQIANIIGSKLGLSAVSKSHEEAGEHFGWFAHFASMDNLASSAQTQQQLGWQYSHKGLLDDLEHGTYFNA